MNGNEISLNKQKVITFDFDVEEGNITFSPNFKQIFGYELSGHLLDAVFQKGIICEKDIDKFFSLPVREQEYNEIELRIKKANEKYIWCITKINTLFDEDKKPEKFVGEIILL